MYSILTLSSQQSRNTDTVIVYGLRHLIKRRNQYKKALYPNYIFR